jgi:hypothetical protein
MNPRKRAAAIATAIAVTTGGGVAATQLTSDHASTKLDKVEVPGAKCPEGQYEIVIHDRRTGICTHGADPAITGPSFPRSSSTPKSVTCDGNGKTGSRVQVLYGYWNSATMPFGRILSATSGADDLLNASAAETGGERHFRFVTDTSCNLKVLPIKLSDASRRDFSNTIEDIDKAYPPRADRKYLVFVEEGQGASWGGIAALWGDDQFGQANANNAQGYARIDVWTPETTVHELNHSLGAVQQSAPHVTRTGHCWDESDVECYEDSQGPGMQQICPTSHEQLSDCNHDDYLNTNPAPGSYLATHWNTANNAFLINGGGSAPPPPPPPPLCEGGTPPPCPLPPPVGPQVVGNGRVTMIQPVRILDTRNSGAIAGLSPLHWSTTLDDGTGAFAWVANVTVTNGGQPGHLTLWPAQDAMPLASSVNWAAGQTIGNAGIFPVGGNGVLGIYNGSAAPVDVVIDVVGWVAA